MMAVSDILKRLQGWRAQQTETATRSTGRPSKPGSKAPAWRSSGNSSITSRSGRLDSGRPVTRIGKVPAKTLQKVARAGPPSGRGAHPERVPLQPITPPVSAQGLSSTQFCTGSCCAPLQRNRSCAYRNLLFRRVDGKPVFAFLSDAPRPAESLTAFTHGRFSDGEASGLDGHSRWAPTVVPRAEAAGVAHELTVPLYIGADLHRNPGHLMLDCVWPALVALLRLRSGLRRAVGAPPAPHEGDDPAQARTASPADRWWASGSEGGGPMPSAPVGEARALLRELLGALPEPLEAQFGFLIYDRPKCCPGWHREEWERSWTAKVAGDVYDLEQLGEACGGDGCLLRTVFVGAGHIGLSAVDEDNVMGGAREGRAVWHFRNRVYARHRVKPDVPPPLPPVAASMRPKVLLVESKRKVSNLKDVAIEAERKLGAHATLIRWEQLRFVDQLHQLREAAVHVSGVGTAQMNAFLLPPGAVAICLGWHNAKTARRIDYFDSHVLHSLDHVRVLYYPSYDRDELARASSMDQVRLNVPKALGVLRSALALHNASFAIPVPLELNANEWDRAYRALADVSPASHMARVGDVDWEPPSKGRATNECTVRGGMSRCLSNSPLQMLLGGSQPPCCPWKPFAARIAKQHRLV